MLMQRTMNHRATLSQRALAGVCVLALCAAASQAQKLTWIDPRTNAGIFVTGVNSRGELIYTVTQGNDSIPYRWKDGELLKLIAVPNISHRLWSPVSEDGKVVIHIGAQAHMWTPSTGCTPINLPTNSYSPGISRNGRIVGGAEWGTTGRARPFIWIDGQGWQNLPYLPGGNWGSVQDVTDDGQYAVGESNYNNLPYETHTQPTLYVRTGNTWQVYSLGTIGGGTYAIAFCLSADASVVVGTGKNAAGFDRGFYWTSNTGIAELGTLGGNNSSIGKRSITANGNVIVGMAERPLGVQCAVWWRKTGNSYTIEDLNVIYASLLQPNERLTRASVISPDGRYIAGLGEQNGQRRLFILDTQYCELPSDVNGSGTVDDADLLEVLFNFGTSCGGGQ